MYLCNLIIFPMFVDSINKPSPHGKLYIHYALRRLIKDKIKNTKYNWN